MMEKMQKFAELLQQDFYHNSFRQWLIALLIFVVILFGLSVVKKILVRRLKRQIEKKMKRGVFEYLIRILSSTRYFFLLVIAMRAAMIELSFSAKTQKYAQMIFAIAFFLQLALWARVAINTYTINYRKANLGKNSASVMTINALSFIAQLTLYTLTTILILDNLGINVTALIAGLGIGGIAVALAAQNLLKDLFASLAIVLDRPFEIGDFIILGDYKGQVEATGIKTTRIRSLSGEQIILPNSDLVESRIRNYKRMQSRRILFNVGVTYDTPIDKLRIIPETIKNIILEQKKTHFDRAHLSNFGDSALNFEVVYFVESDDYNIYMDIQQAINFAILAAFEKEKIEIAFPTQKLIFKT